MLGGTDVDAAVEAEEKALAMIGQELTRFDEQVAQSKQTIADAEFKRRQGDQSKNRTATDTLGRSRPAWEMPGSHSEKT